MSIFLYVKSIAFCGVDHSSKLTVLELDFTNHNDLNYHSNVFTVLV